jgi:hypothetical protein
MLIGTVPILRLTLGAAALATLLPASARAEWQYTRWDMTPEVAVKASNGGMKLLPAKDREKPSPMGTVKVAEGTFQDSEFRLTVEFLIDAKSGGLACVTYALFDARQNTAFRQAMIKRYGTPMGGASTPMAPVDGLAWDKPDTIQYMATSDSAAAVIHCKKGGPMG